MNIYVFDLKKKKKIGKGGFGNVYKIKKKDSEEFFAVKFLQFDLKDMTEPQKMNLIREIDIIQR